MTDAWTLLQRRVRTSGAQPLVTYVDIGRGERTELSAVSLANAGAKIANALRDAFELEAGATVALHLPVHWQLAAWCAGIWTAGCVVATGAPDGDLVVTSPDALASLSDGLLGVEVAVVSMHPFGLPISEPLPSRAQDVTIVVRQQPDAYLFDPPTGASPALMTGAGVLDQDAMLGRAADLGVEWGLEPGGRLLVDATVGGDAALLAALAVPLVCEASVVLVRGDAAGMAEQVAEQEQVTARSR